MHIACARSVFAPAFVITVITAILVIAIVAAISAHVPLGAHVHVPEGRMGMSFPRRAG
jgi:hypothetical protein